LLPLITTALALAAMPAAPKIGVKLSVQPPVAGTLCYPSGMQVRLEERAGTGLASVTAVLDGGTSLEDDTTRSAAHVVEHLWFQSSPGGGPSLWSREAGLELDATTQRDVTTYSTVGAAADLKGLLELEAHRLTDPLQGIDEAILDAEKRVVRSELGLRGEHGARLAMQQLDAVLYPEGHPYRSVVATSAHVDALGLEQLRAYVEAAYTPARTSLSIVADVPLDSQQQLVEAALGDHLGGDGASCGAPPAQEPPPSPASGVARVEGAVWQTQVYVGFTLPPGFSGQDAVATAAVDRLSSLVSSRMGFVRGLRGDAEALAGCSYLPGRLASSATCRIVLPDGVSPDAVVDAVSKVLDEQWSKAERDAYARRVGVAYAVGDGFQQATSASDGWGADALTELAMQAHRGRSASVAETVDELFSVTEPAVVAYASEWLRPERMVGLVLTPGSAAADRAQPVPPVTSLPSPAPSPWSKAETKAEVRVVPLDNGLVSWMAEHPHFVGVRSSLVSEGGWARGPVGADAVYGRLARYRTPITFLDLAAGMGLRFADGLGSWGSWSSNQAAAGNVDMSMWVHRMLLDAVVVEHSEAQGEIDDALEWAVAELPNWPLMHIERIQRSKLYGEHRLGTTAYDRLAAARKLKEPELLGWRKRSVRPDASKLVVATPSVDEAKAAADTYLAGWKVKPSKTDDAVTAPPAPPPRSITTVPWSSRFVTVDVGCRVPGPGEGRAAALDVLEAALESATWSALREGAGAYAPHVTVSAQSPDEALLWLYVDVAPDQAPSTLDALLKVLELTEAGAPPSLVDASARVVRGRLARQQAGAVDHVALLSQAAAQGLDLASVQGRAEAADAVTAADLSALLSSCVGKEAVVVVGPKQALSTIDGAEAYDARAEGEAWVKQLR
jgi:zinc protease